MVSSSTPVLPGARGRLPAARRPSPRRPWRWAPSPYLSAACTLFGKVSRDPLPVAYFVILLSSCESSTYAMLTAPRCTVCRFLLSSCISSTAVHSVDGFLCRAEAFQLDVGPLLSLLSLPVLSVPGHVLRSLSAVCLLRVSWFQPPVCVVRGGGPAAPSRGRAVCPAPCAAEALSPSCPRCPRHGQMTYAHGFISGLWVLFHSSMCLFRCQCHTVLITMSL